MAQYYNRYDFFETNDKIKPLPFIKIEEKNTDKQVIYKLGETRLDILSQRYYSNSYSGWLILLANPEYGGLEFNIPNRAVIRIPFPFKESLQQYQDNVERHLRLYGE